jgi:CBS domain-containing protein
MQARDIMTTNVLTFRADTPVMDIAASLAAWRVSGAPVVDEENRVVGMVSEGDLLRRSELGTEKRRSSWLTFFTDDTTLAKEFEKAHGQHAANIMSRPAFSVTEDATLDEIANLLEKRRIKRLPVVRDGKLVGIITRGDIVRVIARTRTAEPAPAHRSDAELHSEIDERLSTQRWLPAALINVTVHDGHVEIWGRLGTEDQRRALTVLVEEIKGVRSIANHVIVDSRLDARTMMHI